MLAKSRTVNRQYIGKNIRNFMELPNLIDIQLQSYESFLQKEKLDKLIEIGRASCRERV